MPATVDEACEAATHDPWVVSAEALTLLLIIVVITVATILFRRHWNIWYKGVVQKAFAAIDTDESGHVKQEELWAGVLNLYVVLRQQNIPAYPPSREDVTALMRNSERVGLESHTRSGGSNCCF